MTTRSTLEELLARCEGATGPDQELDRMISRLFGKENEHGVLVVADRWLGIGPFTHSLDAIVGLIEAQLPGWGFDLTMPSYGDWTCRAWPGTSFEDNGQLTQFSRAKSGPLALCEILLRATLSSGGDE